MPEKLVITEKGVTVVKETKAEWRRAFGAGGAITGRMAKEMADRAKSQPQAVQALGRTIRSGPR